MAAQDQRQALLEQVKEAATQLFNEVEESKFEPVDQLRHFSKMAANL